MEFVEPDLSGLAANRPMSPEPSADKRDSLNEKQKQGNVQNKWFYFHLELTNCSYMVTFSSSFDNTLSSFSILLPDKDYF